MIALTEYRINAAWLGDLFVCFYIQAVSCLFHSISLAMDFKTLITVLGGAQLDAQEPLLEINEKYEQYVGHIDRNIPRDFRIPFGMLRIGKTIGAGAFGTIKVGRSMM
jgi:hypothetical protein